MAENEDGGEKTENASEKRRQEFREKGDIARSNDATASPAPALRARFAAGW